MHTPKTMASKEVLGKLLDTEKLQYCYECGICTASCPIVELLGSHYNPRELLEKVLLRPEDALASDMLWLCAWCYRCYRRCPQALKIPEIFLFLRAIAREEGYTEPFEGALEKIVENIPLPLITTLVCFHPERAGLDREKVLEKMEKMYEHSLRDAKRREVSGTLAEKVAIIGSGPAGLTVAYELGRKGHGVTIFEALPELGGMLRKCIPESRLPREFLDKEIQTIRELGVETREGVAVGEDLNFDDLWKEGYKAIFIGVGAHRNRQLEIEGVELEPVVHALNFLWDIRSGKKLVTERNVVVIGGGNVAVDAARTALTLGSKEVTILYRRSREEMPANPWDMKEAENTGVKIEFLVSPKKVLGEDGKVSAVECVRIELGELDETGRRRPLPVKDSEFIRETDMVILAIGEAPNLEFLPREIELNENGTIWTDPITMETSLRGVFAGGDAVTGPATVIEAIQAGKCAAKSIETYLKS